MKVPYEVDSTGGLIRVPSDQVGKLRMMMAADGLPKGGSIGYEIFDQKEGFGTTSFVQSINHLRALEGELARTISSMNPIADRARASGAAATRIVQPRHADGDRQHLSSRRVTARF